MTDQNATAGDVSRYDILFEPVRIGPLTAKNRFVLVTSRLPEESLLLSLTGAAGENGFTVRGIGDAWAPGTIAAAVWSGRRYAEELDAALPSSDDVPFRREVTELALLPLIQS
ncbi:MAG TPA: hypothetical protein VMI73_22320 [Trebonia sp.]|nr:hypothetical protein [Trebonia sp.]